MLAARDDAEEAVALMDEATEIALGMRPPNGAANPVKPTFELYGEILLELGRYEDAIEKFETSLLRMPNRARAVLGLARACAEAGDEEAAAEHYAKLIEIRDGHHALPDYQEAMRFLEATRAQ